MTRRNGGCHQHRRLVLLTATLVMAGVVLSWITTTTEIRCVDAYPGAQQRRRRQVRVRRQHRQNQRNLEEEEEDEEEELPQADDPEDIDVEQDKEQQDKEQDKNNAEQDKNNEEEDEEPQDKEQDKEQDKNDVEEDEEQDMNNVEPDNVVTTEQPQATPTAAPVTQQPTNVPTQQPQIAPTSDPVPPPTTQQPTPAPSARPTNSPTASSSSSGQVVTTPTLSPTDPPTPAPTTASPSEPEMIGIPLPKITIDVVVSGEGNSASALPSETTDSMEVTFLLILDKILQDSSHPYNFDYSHIDASVAVSTTLDDNEVTRRHLMMTTTTIRRSRRRMAEGYRIEMDGTAYFGSNSPTSESLEQSLVVYFSFWGTSDVDEYLQESGLTNADVSSVVVGDQNIVVANGPDEEEILAGDADSQNTNNSQSNTSGGEDGSEKTDGSESSEEENDDDGINWIMVIVGLTPAVLAPFVLFACVQYHLRQKRRKAEEKENKLAKKESQSQSEQRDTSKGDISMEKEDEERPEIGVQDAETALRQ